MTRTTLERLRDARHFAAEAKTIAFGMPTEIFADVSYYHYALRYCLLALGEALSHIPAEVQASAPTIPWRAVIGMRHRLAHDFWLNDPRIVLEAGGRHCGPLIESIDRLIEDLTESGD